MFLATVVGLIIYIASHRLISKHQKEELKDPMSSLFSLVGVLVSLMLSLAFAEVIVQLNTVRNTLQREAVAISDTFNHLKLFDADKTRSIRTVLVEYTQGIIDDDWPALADDRLGQRAEELKRRFLERLIELQPETPMQKRIMSWIEQDVDVISDTRLLRLHSALARPPVYLYVIIFGFLITMACFGAYRPQAPLVVLVSLYTSFIGLVAYLILSLGDPFQGTFGVDPTNLEQLVSKLRSESG